MQRNPRVVLLEDDPVIRDMVEMLLSAKECDVFSYEDPSQCPIYQEHKCTCSDTQRCADLIITDIDMPQVSGLEFVEDQLRKGCMIRDIAIISGRWTKEKEYRAKDMGCIVFKKPSFFSALEEWVDSCKEELNQKVTLSNMF